MNLGPGWNNMGKQDFSCQKWLEQGGGGERERGHSLPWAICPPPPFPLPSNPPSPPQRYRGDPRLQPPWWRKVGKRGREECRVGEGERTAWPQHFSC